MEEGHRFHNFNVTKLIHEWHAFGDESDDPRLVQIDFEQADTVAWEHRLAEFATPDWRIPGIYPQDDQAFAAQTVVSSVFNAAFNMPGRPGEIWTVQNPDNQAEPFIGAMALHRSVFNAFGEQPDITADQLAEYLQDEATLNHFLPGVPYPELRLQVGRDFVQGLRKRYDGSVQNILGASRYPFGLDGTIERQVLAVDTKLGKKLGLVDRLADTSVFGSAFEDIAYLGGNEITFNKRAYLTALVYHGRSRTSDSLPPLADIDSIGPVPDYELPRFLRKLGILHYEPELARTVDSWTEIVAGSSAEVQIRAATVVAVAELEKNLNFYRQTAPNRDEPELAEPIVNPAQLDYWLWNSGRQLPNTHPPHLTKTTAY